MNLKPNRLDPKFGVNKNWPTKLGFRKFDNNIHHEKCSIKIIPNFKSIENSGSHQDSINIISQSWNQFFMFCFSCIRNVWSLHMLMCENQIDSLLHQFLQSYIINWFIEIISTITNFDQRRNLKHICTIWFFTCYVCNLFTCAIQFDEIVNVDKICGT